MVNCYWSIDAQCAAATDQYASDVSQVRVIGLQVRTIALCLSI